MQRNEASVVEGVSLYLSFLLSFHMASSSSSSSSSSSFFPPILMLTSTYMNPLGSRPLGCGQHLP